MAPPAARLRAVSFDAAGTLFHPARPVGELYASVAARHGVHVDPAELGTRFRAAFGSAPPLAFPGTPAGERPGREKAWWRAVVSTVFRDLPVPDFDAYFEDLFAFFGTTAAWRVDPDARTLLGALRARGLVTLVISNFDSRARQVLAALELTPLMDLVVLSSEAGAAKPDPAIFHAALGALGLEAAEMLHVGDTVREDLAGARAAGVPVVLVGTPEVTGEAADAEVVARLGELRARIADR